MHAQRRDAAPGLARRLSRWQATSEIPPARSAAQRLQSHVPNTVHSGRVRSQEPGVWYLDQHGLTAAWTNPWPTYSNTEGKEIATGEKAEETFFQPQKHTKKKENLFLSQETVSGHEPAWPRPAHQQMLQRVEHSSRDRCLPEQPRGGRPPLVPWGHVRMAIMRCVLRGWNAQWEVWRQISSAWVECVAPVRVCDQAISHRMEQADTGMSWCCTSRRHPWERVEWWPHARDHGQAHVLTLVEPVRAGVLLRCDRGYRNVSLFDQLTARGSWWIARSGKRVTSKILPVCSQGDELRDAIVSLGPGEGVPATAPVRLILCGQQGTPSRSPSTVLDPRRLPLADVVGLDGRANGPSRRSQTIGTGIIGGVRSQRSFRFTCGGFDPGTRVPCSPGRDGRASADGGV